MQRAIKQILAAPVYEGDEEETRIAGEINLLVWLMLVLTIVGGIVYSQFIPMSVLIGVLSLMILMFFAVQVLLRQGRVRQASFLFIGVIWLMVNGAAVYSGGARSLGFSANVLVILGASLWLGYSYALSWLGLSLLAGMAMVWAESQNLLPVESATADTLISTLTQSLFFFMAASAVQIGVRGTNAALKLAREELAQRKLAEGELLKFRLGIERSGEAIFITEPDGRIAYVNPAFEKIYGYSREEVLGKTPRVLKSGVQGEEVYQHFWGKLLSRQVASGEIVNKTKDGRLLTIDGSANPILDENEKVVGFLAIQRDITQRKQAEQALRRSEERFRALTENSSDAVAVLDDKFENTYRSPSRVRILGYEDDNTPALATVHPDDMPAVTKGLAFLLKEPDETIAMELRLKRKDGSWGWFEVKSQNLLANPAVNGIVVNYSDITERKLANDTMRENEEKFRSFIEQASDGFVLIDEQGMIVEWNRAKEKIWGLKRDQVIGRSYWDVQFESTVPERRTQDRYEYLKTRTREALKKGESPIFNEPIDAEIIRPNGERRFIQQRIFPVKSSEGIRLGSVTRDITDQKRADVELSKLSLAVEQSPVSIVITDTAGNIEYVNPKFTEITGYTREEVIGGNPRILKSGHTTTEEYKRLWQTIVEGGTWRGEFHNKKKNGDLFWESASISPITNESGVVTHFLAVKEDITARKSAREALEQSERRFSKMFNASPIPITLSRQADGAFIDVNDSFLRLSGFEREEVIGRSVAQLGTHPDLEIHIKLMTNLRERGRLEKYEQPFRTKSGKIVDTQLWIEPISVNDEPCALSLALDTTETKHAENLLKQSEERFRRLSEAAFEGIVISDQGKIIDANVRMAAMLGCTQAEMLGADVIQFVAPESRVLVGSKVSSGSEEPYEHLALRKDGRTFPVEVQAKSLPYDGRIVRVSAIRDNSERKRAEQQINRQIARLNVLHTIDTAITSYLDLPLILNLFLEQVIAQIDVDAAAILLLHGATLTLDYAAGRGFRTKALQHTHLRLGEGLAGQVALERRILTVDDLHTHKASLAQSPLLADENFTSYFGAPLIAKGQVKGVLEIFHRSSLDLDRESRGFLDTLTTQAAIAVENMDLFVDLQRSNAELSLAYDTTLEGWSNALDLRDKETEGHTVRVTETAVRLARAMGIGESDLVQVRRGGLLHDIGKMGIPDSILLKPGPLSEEEWKTMRMHPVFAHKLLSPIAHLRPALDIPYCHHEKWDGTGYPRGLKGQEIPLVARIFAVADVWDALRSDRPYRRAWPAKQVEEYIRSESGKHFDPKVVELFFEMLSNDRS